METINWFERTSLYNLIHPILTFRKFADGIDENVERLDYALMYSGIIIMAMVIMTIIYAASGADFIMYIAGIISIGAISINIATPEYPMYTLYDVIATTMPGVISIMAIMTFVLLTSTATGFVGIAIFVSGDFLIRYLNKHKGQ